MDLMNDKVSYLQDENKKLDKEIDGLDAHKAGATLDDWTAAYSALLEKRPPAAVYRELEALLMPGGFWQ